MPFAEAEPGASGLELLLSLVLKWADETGLPLVQALALVTSGPADILRAGSGPAVRAPDGLTVGAPADLCLVDLTADWVVAPEALLSQGVHTPFLGRMLPGRVQATLLGGRPVWERRV